MDTEPLEKLVVRLPVGMLEEINAISVKDRDVSRSETVRRILNEYLNRRREENARKSESEPVG